MARVADTSNVWCSKACVKQSVPRHNASMKCCLQGCSVSYAAIETQEQKGAAERQGTTLQRTPLQERLPAFRHKC